MISYIVHGHASLQFDSPLRAALQLSLNLSEFLDHVHSTETVLGRKAICILHLRSTEGAGCLGHVQVMRAVYSRIYRLAIIDCNSLECLTQHRSQLLRGPLAPRRFSSNRLLTVLRRLGASASGSASREPLFIKGLPSPMRSSMS